MTPPSEQVRTPAELIASTDEVLTIAETANLLRIGESTVKKHAAAGTLPATKIGGQWRITKRAVLDRLGIT